MNHRWLRIAAASLVALALGAAPAFAETKETPS